MKIILKDIPMNSYMFMDGKEGAAVQGYRNDEFGIVLIRSRKSRKDSFVNTWSSEHLPNQEFKTFKDLRDELIRKKIFSDSLNKKEDKDG
ncbi:MAG: hypothetical protein PVH88_01920 [Ignavibacteria bacterium]|jgi:hypothetical protein